MTSNYRAHTQIDKNYPFTYISILAYTKLRTPYFIILDSYFNVSALKISEVTHASSYIVFVLATVNVLTDDKAQNWKQIEISEYEPTTQTL